MLVKAWGKSHMNNWTKLGQIFAPQLVNDGVNRPWMANFAQCPSALMLGDTLRVFFSCRPENDSNGQAVSYTTFADFNVNDMSTLLHVHELPVMPLGDLGSFDEFAVYPTSVIRVGDELWMYYAGWTRMQSVPFNTAIGLAKSVDNGLSFTRISTGPILSASAEEPFVLSGPKVRYFNGQFFMHYLAGKRWVKVDGKPEIIYKIRMATSNDGMHWSKVNMDIVPDILDEDECQAGPDIHYRDGKYHMYFAYRHGFDFRNSPGRGYHIGYAVSDDLYSWKRCDELAGISYSETGWDSEMHHYPHVFVVNGEFYMLFNGNDFGKYGFGLAKLENRS